MLTNFNELIYFVNTSINDICHRSFQKNIRGQILFTTNRQQIFYGLLKFRQEDGCVSAAFYKNMSHRNPWIGTEHTSAIVKMKKSMKAPALADYKQEHSFVWLVIGFCKLSIVIQ